MKFFPKLPFRLFFAAAWVCVGMAPAARGAVDTVTTTADSGPGSLRNTIAAAGSGDTIAFSSALAGQTIYLTSGELLIGQNLTIDASALSGGIAINGTGSSRVLEIGSETVVNLNELTVTNGYVNDDTGAGVLLDDATCSLTASNCIFSGNSGDEYGGAISSFGTLTLNNCTVAGNSAIAFGGGIFGEGGVITLNNCTLSENSVSDGGGGGIESEFGTLTLNDCIVSSNVANAFGGGIDAEDEGALALTNCIFLGNLSGTGGALSAETAATANECAFSSNISTNTAGGGAIVNYDTMTLCNCTLSSNSLNTYGGGGAMVNSGTLTMSNCAVSGNSATNGYGGGLYNPGALTANNCTWSGNTAGSTGGGIYNVGIMTLNNCTLSGNVTSYGTDGNGGGLFTQSQPSESATNILVNCTVCSNSAGLYGSFGGGIYISSAIVMLTNTIVAGNIAANGADVFGSYSGTPNFVGGNPQLAALGNFGGPTPTMLPLPGSPVVDTGTDWVTNFLATDQRGYPRLSGPHVDIGAVEARDFVVLNANDSGNGSLRGILTNSPDYVTFTNMLSGRTIHLTSGELVVSNIMIIDASVLPDGVAIDAGKNSRVLEISNANVTLDSLTLTNGYAGTFQPPAAMGGAVLVDGDGALNASNCVFSGNLATLDGGGIYENGGTVILSDCIVRGNSADGSGGAISGWGATSLSDCTLSNNSAQDAGGIYSYNGTLTLINCTLSRNSAYEAGGIDCSAALTLNQCVFSGNSATDIGGGMQAHGGAIAATNCTFFGNSAYAGGAIESGDQGDLSDCMFSNNFAQWGAGMFNDNGTLTLYYCTFSANTATNGGGGGIDNGNDLTANYCTFSGNSGTNGGAIVNVWEMTLNNCGLFGNSVTNGNGGAIFNYETLAINNCGLSGNSAVNGDGGAIYNDVDNASTLAVSNSLVDFNEALNGTGGGIANGGILAVNSCTFFGDNSTNGGGIFNAVMMTLYNSTFALNSAGSGSGGAISGDSAYSIYSDYATNDVVNCTICGNTSTYGGGLYNDSSSALALTNTIAAENSAPNGADIYGAYSGVANFVGGNPELAGLANYGGSLLTFSPLFGSPVIDAGTDWVTNFLATDQRGFPRLAGKHVDIGAVEAQTAPASQRPILIPSLLSGGSSGRSFQFSFTNSPIADFTVLASTNLALPLAQWTILGNVEQFAGQFQFTDADTTNRARFYRVVSP